MTPTSILSVCAVIVAVGGAIAYINKAIQAIQKPQKENEEKFEHIYKCLTNDKEDIRRIERLVENNTESINFLIKTNLVILKHLESGNDTGLMRDTIKEIEEWLINKNTIHS